MCVVSNAAAEAVNVPPYRSQRQDMPYGSRTGGSCWITNSYLLFIVALQHGPLDVSYKLAPASASRGGFRETHPAAYVLISTSQTRLQ